MPAYLQFLHTDKDEIVLTGQDGNFLHRKLYFQQELPRSPWDSGAAWNWIDDALWVERNRWPNDCIVALGWRTEESKMVGKT